MIRGLILKPGCVSGLRKAVVEVQVIEDAACFKGQRRRGGGGGSRRERRKLNSVMKDL